VYEGPARDALKAFKLGGERRSARALARSMLLAAEGLGGDAVTFVPATRAALTARGFNPAEELARWIAAWCGLPLERLLVKTRETADQSGLGRTERRANLAGAFRASRAPRCVLLVDDVYTTGATADACARALREAGACHVDVLTFARTP
jgi:predicted amidophosphoribosyltransferase